jgi:hypothetical protein
VKEGAGAGYTVTIKGLGFGKILSKKITDVEGDPFGCYECKVEILPGEYEIGAEDYYNDFFWQEHEFGETPDAQIDGGYAIFDIALDGNPDEDDEALFQMNRELENRELDISFDYGWGWTHANLPREEIEADHVDIEGRDVYFGIDKLVLNAPDLADAVNSGFQSTFDRGDEEGEEDDDSMNESADSDEKVEYVSLKVYVSWVEPDESLPDEIYLKVPMDIYNDESKGLDLSGKISSYMGTKVDDVDYREMTAKEVRDADAVDAWLYLNENGIEEPSNWD